MPTARLERAVEIFPDVHRVIARLKTWIRETHTHLSSKHLNGYLAEFAYRFNRRFRPRRDTILDHLVTACCSCFIGISSCAIDGVTHNTQKELSNY